MAQIKISADKNSVHTAFRAESCIHTPLVPVIINREQDISAHNRGRLERPANLPEQTACCATLAAAAAANAAHHRGGNTRDMSIDGSPTSRVSFVPISLT